jgi:hypothetical protein
MTYLVYGRSRVVNIRIKLSKGRKTFSILMIPRFRSPHLFLLHVSKKKNKCTTCLKAPEDKFHGSEDVRGEKKRRSLAEMVQEKDGCQERESSTRGAIKGNGRLANN